MSDDNDTKREMKKKKIKKHKKEKKRHKNKISKNESKRKKFNEVFSNQRTKNEENQNEIVSRPERGNENFFNQRTDSEENQIDSNQRTKNETISPPTNKSEENEIFGPTLPPHLLLKTKETNQNESVNNIIIGPILPIELQKLKESQKSCNEAAEEEGDEDDGIDEMFGPIPATTSLSAMSVAHIELEERALEMKLSKFESNEENLKQQKVREEWMLELPDVGLKPGLATIKRTFHTGKERPDFSDRSEWTKTPNDGKKIKSEKIKDEKKNSQSIYEQQRDIEQEKISKKLKKKQKREESLLEIHQKKLKDEKRKKEKELAASGSKPERRPFSREVDLKMNKIDSHQTKSIVDKAKILNTKFSSGQAKYL